MPLANEPAPITLSRWSVEEYHRMIAADILHDRRVELLNGEIIEMPPEGEIHAHLSTEGADYLRELLRDQAKVREAKPITLHPRSQPEPDIAIVKDLGDVYLDHHPYPEDIFWVVEYSKTSLIKDLELKTKIYAQANIQEYWVIDLTAMELIIFCNPREDSYREKRTMLDGIIVPQAFPEVAIAVTALLKNQAKSLPTS